jgi:hypothetical protein
MAGELKQRTLSAGAAKLGRCLFIETSSLDP